MLAPGCSFEKHKAWGTRSLLPGAGSEAAFALRETQLPPLLPPLTAASEGLAAEPQVATLPLAPKLLPVAAQSPPAALTLLLADLAATVGAPPGPQAVLRVPRAQLHLRMPRAQLHERPLHHRHQNEKMHIVWRERKQIMRLRMAVRHVIRSACESI